MSNFDFIRDFDKTLYELGTRIENEVQTSPSAVTADATTFLEHLLKKLLETIGRKYNPRKDFYIQLDAVYRAEKIDYKYKNLIYSAYLLRNKIHDDFNEIQKNEVYTAMSIHEKLFYIAKKYYRDFDENYDSFKGVPTFKPVQLDDSDDEIELLKVPDFNEIIDINYDYCVICGEPNHSNYSLCCPKCNQIIDNSNNFISIRNYFGKDARFTKEDLIEFGIKEGYANQLISSLTRQNMFKVTGRYITFNNMYLEDYLLKIDKYLSICELITLFREDKITPSEIKSRTEYKQGSRKQEPYYQFFKVIDHEIINKFERDILTTRDVTNSMEYTTITQKQLERWYKIQMASYKKGNVNESFVVFNELLMNDYLEMKRNGILDSQIRKSLNITDEIYEFWGSINENFDEEIAQIKIDLLLEAITQGKTRAETIEYAGVTPREYENIVKVANFNNTDFAQIRNAEIEKRKAKFIGYLKINDLETSCGLAKFSLEDFYDYYDASKESSEFYIATTKILMDKYLAQRKISKSKKQAIEAIGLKEKYIDRWLTRSKYRQFKDEDLKITVDIILRGFKNKKPILEIAESADVTVNAIHSYISLGERGSELYRPLYEYYVAEILPLKLESFLEAIHKKTIRKSYEIADLTENEVEKYYLAGKNGDEKYRQFYEDFFEIKKAIYAYHIQKGKSHKIAMRESALSKEEYSQNRDELDEFIRLIKIKIILDELKNKKNSTVMARNANCSVDEMYDWYFRGKDGEEEFEKFYDVFHSAYVRPNINAIIYNVENKNESLENIIRANKDQVTRKDIKIWIDHGLLDNKVLKLNTSKKDDDDDDDYESKFNANELLREMGIEDYDKVSIKKSSISSSILNTKDLDVDELKKQILRD